MIVIVGTIVPVVIIILLVIFCCVCPCCCCYQMCRKPRRESNCMKTINCFNYRVGKIPDIARFILQPGCMTLSKRTAEGVLWYTVLMHPLPCVDKLCMETQVGIQPASSCFSIFPTAIHFLHKGTKSKDQEEQSSILLISRQCYTSLDL